MAFTSEADSVIKLLHVVLGAEQVDLDEGEVVLVMY